MSTENTATVMRWDIFIEACRTRGVAEERIRWYILRIKRYISAHPEKSVEEHDPAAVRRYLERAGRDPGTAGWLFLQLVHSLQILHCDVIGREWAQTFDWQFWLDSAQELESRHATLARHNHSTVVGEQWSVQSTD